MWTRTLPAAGLAGLLTLSVALSAPAAPEDTLTPPTTTVREPEDRSTPSSLTPSVDTPSLGSALRSPSSVTATAQLPGKPRNDVIVDVPVNPNDASIPMNLTPYHAFAPALRALQQSDRVSVEIIGQSAGGRDLHLVVVTSPMSDAEWTEWQRLSDLRTEDPDAAIAALEAGEYDDWKSPLFVNNNIHGNE